MLTSEQRLQYMKSVGAAGASVQTPNASQTTAAAVASQSSQQPSGSGTAVATPAQAAVQVQSNQAAVAVSAAAVATTTVNAAPSTPPSKFRFNPVVPHLIDNETRNLAIRRGNRGVCNQSCFTAGIARASRIIASPLQTPTVVSVALTGMSPAQLQAAGRLIVSTGAGGQAKAVVAGAGTAAQSVQGKQFTAPQLMIKAATKNQLRLHAAASQAGVKTSTVTIGGQPAVVQFTQAQTRTAQFVRQAGN